MPAHELFQPRSWSTLARRACGGAAAVAVAAVSWAAARDIFAGGRDATAEWTCLAFGVLLCGYWLMGRLLRARERPR